MKKVLLFSFFLVLGLVVSQMLPAMVGEQYSLVKTISNTFLFICLAFIMINVGREFEIDKTRWKSYTEDYFIAMATAAFPWIFVALYYMFVLLPGDLWGSWDAWKENLLLSRFAAPTSAGILFTMLAAAGLKASWVYKKVQVLAIFDDLDTILLMIPLQIMMIGLRWQLGVIILVVVLLLILGWKKMGYYNVRQDWKAILFYAVVTFGITQVIYLVSKHMYGEEASIHIEVLLPAFVVGMIMPVFMGVDFAQQAAEVTTVTGSQPMMSWSMIALHVVIVSFLSNIGKLFPLFFYRDRMKRERLALSIGMFTRGEVGAGVIFIALGYGLGGPMLIISVLTIVFNLILTGIFVIWVEKLTRSAYNLEQAGKAKAVN